LVFRFIEVDAFAIFDGACLPVFMFVSDVAAFANIGVRHNAPLLAVVEVLGLVQRPRDLQGGVWINLEMLGQNVSDIGYDLRDHSSSSSSW
jgi:hypothetical protein